MNRTVNAKLPPLDDLLEIVFQVNGKVREGRWVVTDRKDLQ